MLTEDLSAPLDDLKDLDADQLENLQSWEERFSEKYLVVGKLVAEGDPEAPNSWCVNRWKHCVSQMGLKQKGELDA